ncbi:DUF2165 domain-containing protein [Bathymodiolus japonicus methanotrophic gill symbiont]|uniref:DUF2165 domain-containing protein n=1 Tax=Bathymodiolus japonicus methanotrophic gill symbiont TaxID=113269 RepID=UPI0021E123ED|nr:DUF2165 domain-containing protein [Bathymodiolus japonicus methanotrophic gill symbiont]
MDAVFQHNRDSWWAIDTPFVYHAAYFFIIIVDVVIAVLCWLGGCNLFSSENDLARFNIKLKGLQFLG